MSTLVSGRGWVTVSLLIALTALGLGVYVVLSKWREVQFSWLDSNEAEKDHLYTDFYMSWKEATAIDGMSGKTFAYRNALHIGLASEDAHPTTEVRIARRANKVATMSSDVQEKWKLLASLWVSSVGIFAHEASLSGVALRTFLQTHHLEVIREAVIVEPVLVWAWDKLSPDEKENALWGLSLLRLSVRYHKLTPVQRNAVYFKSAGVLCGPVLESGPGAVLGRFFDLVNSLSPWLRLRKRNFLGASRRMNRSISALANNPLVLSRQENEAADGQP